MKRYLILIWRLFRYSLIRDIEFRFNLISWSLANILWAALIIVSVNLIFGQVNNIAGWTRQSGEILVVTYTVFGAFFWLFILPSLGNFSRFIRNGDLDFYLQLPVNLRFLITFNRFEFDQVVRFVITIFILANLIIAQNPAINIINWLVGVVLLIEGLLLFYNLYFILITLNFWLPNLNNLEWLTEMFLEFGRYPTEIFKGSLRMMFTIIIPIVFVATFPVQAWLGKNMTLEVLYGLGLIILTFIVSQWFWNFALKRYSSASS